MNYPLTKPIAGVRAYSGEQAGLNSGGYQAKPNGVDAAEPARPLHREVERQSELVNELLAQLSELEARLIPVCEPPAPCDGAEANNPPMPLLLGILNRHNASLVEACSRITSLRARLQF